MGKIFPGVDCNSDHDPERASSRPKLTKLKLRTLNTDSEIKEKYNLAVPNTFSALNNNQREQMNALITQTAEKLLLGIAKCKDKIDV